MGVEGQRGSVLFLLPLSPGMLRVTVWRGVSSGST